MIADRVRCVVDQPARLWIHLFRIEGPCRYRPPTEDRSRIGEVVRQLGEGPLVRNDFIGFNTNETQNNRREHEDCVTQPPARYDDHADQEKKTERQRNEQRVIRVAGPINHRGAGKRD